jgi:hypothetical protein
MAIFFVCFLSAMISALFMHIRFSQNRYLTGKEIPPEKKSQVKQRYILTPLFLLGFGIYMGFFWEAPVIKEDPNAWKTKDNKTMAYTMMQEFVKDYLISPGSAKFEWISEPDCKISKEGFEYYISSWVDSQNSFGAMLRTRFEGTIEQVDDKNWNIRALYMNDQRAYIDWVWVKNNKLGKINIYDFISNFQMFIKHFVSENADSYVIIDSSSNPVVINTSRIGEYIIKTHFDDDGYVKNVSFSYISNDTKYQSDMSTKVFLTFISAIEIFNTYEETENIVKEMYRNRNDELTSLSGNKYTKNIDYPNYIYNVEINY